MSQCVYTMLGAVKCLASKCVTNDEMNGKEDLSKTERYPPEC